MATNLADLGSDSGDLGPDFMTAQNLQNLNEIIENGMETESVSHDDRDYVMDFPRLNNFDEADFDYYTISKYNALYNHEITDSGLLKVMHVNIRGIQSNFDNLVLYLNTLDHSFDFICLSECHLPKTANIDDRFNLEGYDKYVVYSTIKSGGCIIYARSAFNTELVSQLCNSTNSCDYIYIKLPNPKGKSLLIGCYYRHCRSKKSDVMNFLNELENCLEDKTVKSSKLVLVGDFNLDLCKINHDHDVSAYFNCLLSNSLENHILKPTRIQYYPNSLQVKSATLIDHVSSNLYEHKCLAGNLYFSNSDHFANFAIFENVLNPTASKSSQVPPMRRDFSKLDHGQLVCDINAINWFEDVCNDSLEINKCTQNMISHIQDLSDKHIPKTQCSKRKSKYASKPWIDAELLKLIVNKNRLFRKMKKHPSEINKDNFTQSRAHVNKLNKQKKKNYFTKYFENHRTNSKKTWEGLYLAMEMTKRKKTLGTCIKDLSTGKIHSNPKEIVNGFANYFEQVPINVRNKLPSNIGDFSKYMSKRMSNSMYFAETTPLEVFTLINQLKNSCSTGDVDIPNQFLKLINFPLSYILAYLINRSLKVGIMPDALKVGKQTPVFKSGLKAFSNYRPITVVNSFAKLFEKIAGHRLTGFLDRFNILNNRQFGFRKHHSTIHAMINLLDTCLDGLNNKLSVGGVFLDISKAFDSVDHTILLNKLEHYGIRGITLDWFRSYLCQRELFVSADGASSHRYILKYGIPQGSVLGPILFLLYINDVVNSSDKLVFSMFADDTALVLKVECTQYDESMKFELQNVMRWFDANLLLLNIDKTKYLYFGPEYNSIKALHSITPDYIYKKSLDRDYVQPEDSDVKYLGVIFDSHLKFEKQVRSIAMKISRMVGILWQCKDLHIEAKLTIYHSLVASHLNYGILIWGTQLSKNLAGRFKLDHVPIHLKKVNTAHNKVIRAITRSKKYDKETKVVTHTAPLLKYLNLLSVNGMYYLQLALFAYDCLRSVNLPSLFEDYLTTSDRVYDNRASVYDVSVPRVRLESTLGMIKVAASYLWNLLPHSVRSVNYSRNVFKSKVKAWLISQY